MFRRLAIRYSIIIPAYNEAERLPASLDKMLAYMKAKHWDAEVLVVNDGSKDKTADIVRDYNKRFSFVRLIENPGNHGKGYSVRHGMMEAFGDIRLLSDADFSSPIEEADKLFAALAAGADVAIGSRWKQRETQTVRQPFYRQVGGRIFNLILRIVLGLPEKDTQCGFKAFSRKAAQMLFPPQKRERWGWDAEMLFLAHKAKLRVDEVPVAWANDDRSRINPWLDGIRIVVDALAVRWYSMRGDYKDITASRWNG